MPINSNYNEEAIVEAIATSLDNFYTNLISNIDKLNIKKVMKRKNPYLFRAKAMNGAAQIIDAILAAFVSSSEETIFGNVFFEPIATAAAQGQKALAEGVDIMVERDNTIYAIAVKSGTSVFNADSRKKQEQNFMAASKLAQQAKKRFVPIVGQVAIAGILAKKKFIPESAGTLQTDTVTFGVMTFAVIFIVAALSFFPVHALSTIAEHLSL